MIYSIAINIHTIQYNKTKEFFLFVAAVLNKSIIASTCVEMYITMSGYHYKDTLTRYCRCIDDGAEDLHK